MKKVYNFLLFQMKNPIDKENTLVKNLLMERLKMLSPSRRSNNNSNISLIGFSLAEQSRFFLLIFFKKKEALISFINQISQLKNFPLFFQQEKCNKFSMGYKYDRRIS